MGSFAALTELAFGDDRAARFGASVAQTANFLDGGTVDAPAVAAPVRSAADLEVDRRARAAAAERQRQRLQATYSAQRARERADQEALVAHLTATDPHYAALRKQQNTAGVDFRPFINAGKVLATGAAVIASGGAVAGALGVTAAGGAIGASVAADRVLAAVDQGGKIAADAKAVISDAQRAAAAGNVNARAALGVLGDVAADRAKKLIPPGVEQTLTAAGKQAAAALELAAGQPHAPAVVSAVAASGGKPAPASSKPPAFVSITNRPVAVKPTTARPLSPSFAVKVDWVVTLDGKVVRGPSTLKGWRVYSDGKVLKQ